jgi:hypothetical protein
MSTHIHRRHLIRGLGAGLALPWLEAMVPSARGAVARPPLRMAFAFTPNGYFMPNFVPQKTGADFELPPTLEPLAAHKQDLLVLSGLALDNGRAKGDGAGDHARALGSFLTAAHPHKTGGEDIRAGVSVDQVAAARMGHKTPLPSLELGTERTRGGQCDSGYSCAYTGNISWKTDTLPIPPEVDPRQVFDRLFGGSDSLRDREARARRRQRQLSVLDFVQDEAKALSNRLGSADREKIDEYFAAIRDVELRIERSAAHEQPPPPIERPSGPPGGYKEHLHLHSDLLTMAFQLDLTRVATFMYGMAGSNRSYREIGVKDGHHYLSHHRENAELIEGLKKVDRYQMEQFAYLLSKLAETKEGEGRLLDNCMIMLGSGLGDGNRHRHHDLPIILAGQAGGAFKSGRHLRYATDTPLANLFVRMLNTMGVAESKFGDSTGALPGLS